MEQIVKLHVEKLPEGVYLATSEEIQGLLAQGRTLQKTPEIARNVARRLIEARMQREGGPKLAEVEDSFDFSLVVSA